MAFCFSSIFTRVFMSMVAEFCSKSCLIHGTASSRCFLGWLRSSERRKKKLRTQSFGNFTKVPRSSKPPRVTFITTLDKSIVQLNDETSQTSALGGFAGHVAPPSCS